jgi:putative ABC transport system ATP-binding protein
MADVVVKLEDVTKVYRMGELDVPALSGVSTNILEGEFIAIIGPSGSGKSTMLHIIGCLDRPTSGKAFVGGEDTTELTDSRLAKLRSKRIGFVFQTFNLYPTLSALENVELPMMIAGTSGRKRRKRAKALLEQVGLGERASHFPSQLSGGERQRVAIARALSNEPQIILADEPTGNLDTKSGEEVLSIFKNLNHEGNTIIIVTHDLNIAKWTKRILKMKDGKLEENE